MSLTIHCPSCFARYQLPEHAAGKRVRCKKCGTTFMADETLVPSAEANPSFDLLTADLSQLTSSPAPSARSSAPSPVAQRMYKASSSNPSGGPTDMQMRLVCAGMLGLGVILAVANYAMFVTQGSIYIAVLVLVPLALVFGVAGLISPNVVRAMGKYGGHLSWQYKAVGFSVLGLSFVLMIVAVITFLRAGFEPDRPGARTQVPGLSRSQVATVMERIQNSYAASPDANTVRTVSFEVFGINGNNPESEAERVLSTAAGYVSGSFRIGADRKSLTFQYKGDKEIAPQYALLLPGPTGIYMVFTPQFVE